MMAKDREMGMVSRELALDSAANSLTESMM